MSDRAPADVGFGDLMHLDRGLDAGWDADALEGILERKCVDDGREHPHVIGGRAFHARGFMRLAAPDVAAADDDGD